MIAFGSFILPTYSASMTSSTFTYIDHPTAIEKHETPVQRIGDA